MTDYFDELGHDPTGPDGPDDFAKHFKRLQVLAAMNGIDIEIEAPHASKMAVKRMPVNILKKDDPDKECAVCKQPGEKGQSYKILPCKHEFHDLCIYVWLKKSNSCPMCRYEIETDDPDYEELRKFRQGAADRKARLDGLMDSMFT